MTQIRVTVFDAKVLGRDAEAGSLPVGFLAQGRAPL